MESNKNRVYPWLFWLILEICCIGSNSRLSEKLICLTLWRYFPNRVKHCFYSPAFSLTLRSFLLNGVKQQPLREADLFDSEKPFVKWSQTADSLKSCFVWLCEAFSQVGSNASSLPRFSSLTLWAFSYYRVKHQKSSPSLLLKISVTLCKLALKSAIIHVKGRWKILWEDFQKDNICILQKGNQHHAHKSV